MVSLIAATLPPSNLHCSPLKLFHLHRLNPCRGKRKKNKTNSCVFELAITGNAQINPVHRQKAAAAFFDVDGTITRTNVVFAYFCGRVREIPLAFRLVWLPWFALSCIVYMMVDRIDRTLFNHLFYFSSFKDRSALDTKSSADVIYQNYYRPRTFGGAVELIQQLKEQGYHIVLVTGCLDFLIAPLARDLGADFLYASELVEEGGRFTGEIKGAGASYCKKALCVQSYATKHQLCLSSSLAFGDCIADLSMLESVGGPHAVNPDGQLKGIAKSRGWPIIRWKLEGRRGFDLGCISSIFKAKESTLFTSKNLK